MQREAIFPIYSINISITMACISSISRRKNESSFSVCCCLTLPVGKAGVSSRTGDFRRNATCFSSRDALKFLPTQSTSSVRESKSKPLEILKRHLNTCDPYRESQCIESGSQLSLISQFFSPENRVLCLSLNNSVCNSPVLEPSSGLGNQSCI